MATTRNELIDKAAALLDKAAAEMENLPSSEWVISSLQIAQGYQSLVALMPTPTQEP